MKSSPYRNGLAIAGVAIFFTNLPSYLLFHHAVGIPWYWILGFCLLSLPMLIVERPAGEFFKSPVVMWCFGYLWLTIVGFLTSSQSETAWQEVRWRLLTVLDLVVFLALLGNPQRNKLARQTLVPAVLLGVALNIYEQFVPLSFSPIIGRSAGLYMNATTSALALVGGMIFAVTILPSWLQGGFVLLTGVGVFVTYSRGGIVAWLVAVAGFALAGKVSVKDLLRAALMCVVVAGVFLLPRLDQLLSSLDSSGAINKNVEERLEWFANPTGVADQSSWSRAYVALQAWQKFSDAPWIGSGTGAFRDAFFIPPHNQNLSFMVDHGILGAAIMPLLILAISWRTRGDTRSLAVIFGGIQIMASFMSHTIVNEEHTLFLYALMATISAQDIRSAARSSMAVRRRGAQKPCTA